MPPHPSDIAEDHRTYVCKSAIRYQVIPPHMQPKHVYVRTTAPTPTRHLHPKLQLAGRSRGVHNTNLEEVKPAHPHI